MVTVDRYTLRCLDTGLRNLSVIGVDLLNCNTGPTRLKCSYLASSDCVMVPSDVTEKLVLVPFGLCSSPDLVSSQSSPVVYTNAWIVQSN